LRESDENLRESDENLRESGERENGLEISK
jgi:hypothetical protein